MRSTRPRLTTFDYVGLHYIFLTFCTHMRKPHFTDATVVTLAREQILRAAAASACAVTAYVFMPDHVHLLVKGLTPATDGYATLSIIDIDFGGASDDGIALEFGVRHMMNEQVELFGNLQYVDMTESETGFEFGGRYWFQKNLGASFSYTTFDGDNTILIAGRYNF